MAPPKIASEFKRTFEAGLKSGKNQHVINGVIKRIETPDQMLACLGVYCQLFDPQCAHRNSAAGDRQVDRPRALHARGRAPDPTNTAAKMVRWMARLEAGEVPTPDMPAQYAVYFARWTAVPSEERRRIAEQARITLRDRANAKADTKLLMTTLVEEYRKKKGEPHKTVVDLIRFNPADEKQRAAFAKLAMACANTWVSGGEAVRTDPKKRPKVAKLSDALWKAFEDFGKYLKSELNSPVDFFRLLALAREGSAAMAPIEIKSDGGVIRHPPAPWNNVWEELYFEVAWRGQNLAVSKWGYRRMENPGAFVADDLEFILRPLDAHGEKLLAERLKLARYREKSEAFHRARRRAYLVGTFKAIDLLDEVETVETSDVMRAGWERDARAVARRFVYHKSDVAFHDRKYWNLQTIEDAFTVLWIEKEGLGGTALIEVEAMPGFVFRARVGQMFDLHQEAFFRALARNAAALTAFLLFYLKVLGFAFDIVTAGISGGLRHFVFHFAQERLLDKLGDVAMDAADIQNPGIRILVSVGVNAVPKPNLGGIKLRSDGEIDADAAVAAARKADVPVSGKAPPRPKPDIPKGKPDVSARTGGGGPDDGGIVKVPLVKLNDAVKAEIEALYPRPSGGGIRAAIADNLDRATQWVDEAIGPSRGLFEEAPAAAGAGVRGSIGDPLLSPLLRVGGKPPATGLGTGGRAAPRPPREVDKLASRADFSGCSKSMNLYLEASARDRTKGA